ncbi:hypothetical protein [Aquabacterium humicola]|uniref:hypothetical protein n=1 Tax=Aquabacterium humicola TaxID=3237377 RepID=UPI002543E638|nr:hypothetical protein [Rubrivivax pictus]
MENDRCLQKSEKNVDDIADLSAATLQYERYLQLQLLANADERGPVTEQRRADWTHPMGLVMMAC